jgi:2-aminoadipate transaminase
VMLDALEEHMPDGVKWTRPHGGLFLWATLPEVLNTTNMLKDAINQRVAYVPGENFYTQGGGSNTMRLNFSCSKPDMINEGIARLGKVFKSKLLHP